MARDDPNLTDPVKFARIRWRNAEFMSGVEIGDEKVSIRVFVPSVLPSFHGVQPSMKILWDCRIRRVARRRRVRRKNNYRKLHNTIKAWPHCARSFVLRPDGRASLWWSLVHHPVPILSRVKYNKQDFESARRIVDVHSGTGKRSMMMVQTKDFCARQVATLGTL